MVTARVQNGQRSSSPLNRYRSWAASLKDHLFKYRCDGGSTPHLPFLLPLPHEMFSNTTIRREGFKALIYMDGNEKYDLRGNSTSKHNPQGVPVDNWGSDPKYDPLSGGVDQWIQDVSALLKRDKIQKAGQPRKAMKYIANRTISNQLGKAVEQATNRGHIEWDSFTKFMVEFQSEWYFFATIKISDRELCRRI